MKKKSILILTILLVLTLFSCKTDPEVPEEGSSDSTTTLETTGTETSAGSPEISVLLDDTEVNCGATIELGSAEIFTTVDISDVISNTGDADLIVNNLCFTGDSSELYKIISSPDTVIAGGSNSNFRIRAVVGTSAGDKLTTFSLSNNDADEADFTLNITSSATARTWIQQTSPAWRARSGHRSISFDDKLWVIGGCVYDSSGDIYLSDIQNSEDGINWNLVMMGCPWSVRADFACAEFLDKLWIIGGRGVIEGIWDRPGDVWSSTDCINWTEEIKEEDSPWKQRYGLESVVFNDKLWVLGGYGWHEDINLYNEFNDVWSSEDGVEWTEVTHTAAWPVRSDFGCFVYDDKIWILGGNDSDIYYNDVWCSEDGETWTEVLSSAPWSSRSGFGALVSDNIMWVMGGAHLANDFLKDIWYSTDGENWFEYKPAEEYWSERRYSGNAVFNDKIWITGGKQYASSSSKQDVWSW